MKLIYFDIETGKNDQAEKFIPEFTQPKMTKEGKPYANSKSIEEQKTDWLAKTALDAKTGRIICVKTFYPNVNYIRHEADERSMLEWFWKEWLCSREEYFCGWNVFGFDMKFLYQRSLILGVKVPINPIERYWYKQMTIDLMEVWNLYQPKEFSSLNDCAKALGFGAKAKDGAVSKNYEQELLLNREETLKADELEMRLLSQVGEILINGVRK